MLVVMHGFIAAVPRELPNIVNTCWMNAILQCFFNLSDLKTELLEKKLYKADTLADVFVETLRAIEKTHVKGIVQAEDLVFLRTNLGHEGFVLNQFADSAQFLGLLNNHLFSDDFGEHDWLDEQKPAIDDLKKMVYCEEKNVYFPTDNPRAIRKEDAHETSFLSIPHRESVQKAFNDYFSSKLIELDQFKPADNPVQHSERSYLLNSPEYITVVIAWTRAQNKIDVTEKLEVPVGQENIIQYYYDLVGAAVNLSEVHYIAYVKDAEVWYRCDDFPAPEIKKVEKPFIESGRPLVLFYKKQKNQEHKDNARLQEKLFQLAMSLQALAHKI